MAALVPGSLHVVARHSATEVAARTFLGFQPLTGVYEVRLRMVGLTDDGTELGTVLDETFDTLDAWDTVGSVTLDNVQRRMLDLSFIQEVLLQLDFTAAFDFPAPPA